MSLNVLHVSALLARVFQFNLCSIFHLSSPLIRLNECQRKNLNRNSVKQKIPPNWNIYAPLTHRRATASTCWRVGDARNVPSPLLNRSFTDSRGEILLGERTICGWQVEASRGYSIHSRLCSLIKLFASSFFSHKTFIFAIKTFPSPALAMKSVSWRGVQQSPFAALNRRRRRISKKKKLSSWLMTDWLFEVRKLNSGHTNSTSGGEGRAINMFSKRIFQVEG